MKSIVRMKMNFDMNVLCSKLSEIGQALPFLSFCLISFFTHFCIYFMMGFSGPRIVSYLWIH